MLNIDYKFTNIELNDQMKEYLEKRMKKVAKYIEEDTEAYAQVEIAKSVPNQQSGDIFRAEINIEVAGSSLYRAEAEKTDLYQAIDDAQSDVIREMKKSKQKKTTLFRRGARKLKRMLRRPEQGGDSM